MDFCEMIESFLTTLMCNCIFRAETVSSDECVSPYIVRPFDILDRKRTKNFT